MKTLSIFLGLLSIIVFSSAVLPQQTPETAETYFKLGLADLEADRYETAEEYFSIALGVKPDHAAALLARAKTRHYKGDYSGALADANGAVKIDPALGEAYFLRARLRGFELINDIQEKRKDIAPDAVGKSVRLILEDYDAAVKNSYISVAVFKERGEHKCLLLSMCASAVADFDRAIAIEPGDIDLQERRTVAKFKSGDWQGATSDYLKITGRTAKKMPEGQIFKTKRSYQESRELAKEISGAIAQIFLKNSSAAMEDNSPEIVITELNRGIALFPDNPALFAARANYGRFTNSKEFLESDALRMVELDPFNFQTQRTALHYLMGIQKCSRALELMNRAALEDPRNAEAYLWRGNARSCSDDFQGALEDNDRAIALEPGNETFKANRANLLSRMQQTADSLETYSSVIEELEAKISSGQNENDVAKARREISYALISRSRIYAKQNMVKEAFADLDRAVEILPEFNSFRTRARAYLWQKDYEKAIRDYDEVIRLQPEALASYIDRGDVYFQMGNFESALRDYEKAAVLKGDIAELVQRKIAAAKAGLAAR